MSFHYPQRDFGSRRRLCIAALFVSMVGCGTDPGDASHVDAGHDAGAGDAGDSDAGTRDAAPPDLDLPEIGGDPPPRAWAGLPEDCAGAPEWEIGVGSVRPTIAGFGTDELWIHDRGSAGLRFKGPVLHFTAAGGGEVLEAGRVNSLWACGQDDVWMAGDDGAVWHYDGESLEPIDVGSSDHLLAGAGCSGDVWLATADALYHYDGTGPAAEVDREIVDEPDVVGSSWYPVELLEISTGLAVLSQYGRAYVQLPGGAFRYVELSDDLNTGLLVHDDLTGFSLHEGLVLLLDASVPTDGWHEVEALDASVVSVRAEDDAWFAHGDQLYWYDGTFYPTSAPYDLLQIDARAGSLWVIGDEHASYRSRSGWCRVSSSGG